MSHEAVSVAPRQTILGPAALAALITGAALVAKVVIIIASSNTAPDAVTGALYVIGVFTPIVVAIAIARRKTSMVAKIATGVGIVLAHLFYVTMLSDGVEALVAPFTDTVYVLDEVPVAVLGIIWLMVGARLLRSDR